MLVLVRLAIQIMDTFWILITYAWMNADLDIMQIYRNNNVLYAVNFSLMEFVYQVVRLIRILTWTDLLFLTKNNVKIVFPLANTVVAQKRQNVK
jgi:hypothetical protein